MAVEFLFSAAVFTAQVTQPFSSIIKYKATNLAQNLAEIFYLKRLEMSDTFSSF